MNQRTRLAPAAAVLFFALATVQAVQETPRESWQRLDDIFAALGAQPGAQIADVGAGDGYFTTRLSKIVGEDGSVYSVDVDPSALGRLRKRIEAEALRNVRIVEGTFSDPRLPVSAIDGALIVNAYHEMDRHQEMLAGIRKALKPNGRLVIVEPISERLRDASRANQTRRHEIGPQYVQDDLRQAGYRIVRFEEEFTRRPYGETEWIIVAVPDAGQSSDTGPPPRAADVEDDVEDWEAASIRIDVEAARRLFESGMAVFIDVRNRPMFEEGRIVGAKLVPLPKVESEISGLVKLRKRLITYCS